MSIGLICVFIFVLLTVCFGVLFYKVNEENALNNWPAPSNSLYGEYLHGAVAADNIFCSEIGRNTLMKGGNAVDAAISTLTCIGVLNVHSAGLGGGHFMTLYNA
jgi:gamma-glutamyltranspeptidase/glutathione hydrolase/leukotriene-C4 hydrolase